MLTLDPGILFVYATSRNVMRGPRLAWHILRWATNPCIRGYNSILNFESRQSFLIFDGKLVVILLLSCSRLNRLFRCVISESRKQLNRLPSILKDGLNG